MNKHKYDLNAGQGVFHILYNTLLVVVYIPYFFIVKYIPIRSRSLMRFIRRGEKRW